MSQIRFGIGVPRAGDAARSSEEHTSGSDGWTRAKKVGLSGSAARAAEDRKREEGVAAKPSNTIALRASGGAIVDAATMLQHSTAPAKPASGESSSRENAVSATHFSEAERISSSRTVSPAAVPGLAVNGEPEHRSSDTSVQPGLLQSAAARIQSLTRSLFQSRDANSQPRTIKGEK